MAETTVTSFPLITVPNSEKTKDYHTRWVRGIVSNTFNNSWTTNYLVLRNLYSFFLDGTGSDLTNYLQAAPDGSQMPGIWTSLKTAKARLRNLIGELEERGYNIKARAVNPEAVSRKLEEKERLRVKRVLQPVREEAEQMSGVPLEKEEYVPQSEEELNEYMDLSWKDKNVLIIEGILKWISATTNWDEKRKAAFRDILISNRGIFKNEILQGVPQARRVDPLKFIFDPNSTDDMLSDSTYFGEVDYIPLAQAAQEYGLNEKELEECYNTYSAYLGLGLDGRSAHENDSTWGCMPGQTLRWFKLLDGTPRCLVIRACWRDYKVLSHKYEKNEKYDSEHLQDVTDKPVSKSDNIVSNRIECWRQGTLVGGKYLVDWGECPNQARELNSLEKSEPPYKVWVPDFLLGRSVSLMEELIGLQVNKDIAAYQIQIQVARAIGKVLVMDEAFLPEGMTRENAMSYIKAEGIAWVNSKEYQMGTGNMNLFKDYDVSLSESIGQCLQLIQYYDQQMDEISGVSQARQGIMQGSSQQAAVTQAAIFQSSLTTAPLFKGFYRLCSRVYNHQAKLAKIAWAGKEVFAPIIGDVGVNFLKDNIDISVDQFDIVVQETPPSTLERSELKEMVMVALQAQPEFLPDALAILIEPDTTVAVRKFQKRYALRQIYAEQQAQAQAQAEQEAQQQQMAMQQQNAAMQIQSAQQLQQMKNESNREKTLITGKVKLNTAKLDLLKQ